MEQFSTQWFTAYYVALGALLLSYGVYLLIKTATIREFLTTVSKQETPPTTWKKILKYLLLFTLPGVILSFTPFSWIELLFSVWSLFIIIILGQLLVLWPQTSKAIQAAGETLNKKIRYAAANMITIGVILFMLCYLLLERTRSV